VTVIVSLTSDNKAVIHLDRRGERGVTIEIVEQDEPGFWLVEVWGWGFSRPWWEPQLIVRAKSRFEAVRRAAGAVLLVYED
jgi:hypothetical protein